MPAAYASVAAAAVAATTATVTVTKPTGVVAGDLLIASCWANNTASTWSATGWTSLVANAGVGGAILYRVADGTEGADFTYTRASTSGTAGVTVVRVTAAGTPQAGACSSTLASATITLTGATAAVSDSLLLQFAHSVNTTADTWSPPGTAVERADANATGQAIRYAVGDEAVGVGATGTRVWTHTNGTAARGSLLAINPVLLPNVQQVTYHRR